MKGNLKTFIRNLHTLFVSNEQDRITQLYNELSRCKQQIEDSNNKIDLLTVVSQSPEGFNGEIEYLREHGICTFPYKQLKEMDDFYCGYDEKRNMPYVMHNNHSLYFPHSYDIETCKIMYRSYISEECLLGGGYRDKSPHQYQTDNFKIEEGDVLIDVGCAEALLSLDNIEKVSKVFLIETDPIWIPALEATFEDYRDKIVIINKFVSDTDTETTITLQTLLEKECGNRLFIKMDIEGAEVAVLNGSFDFLRKCKNIKIACCTYHRRNDAEEIRSIFDRMGFNYEFSNGYMLFRRDGLEYPYFRHGVLRGWK